MDALKGWLFDYGKGKIQSILGIKENLRILETKIEELSSRESDVEAGLKIPKVLYGQKPKSEVKLWLRNVRQIKTEICDIKQKVEEVRWYQIPPKISLAELVQKKIEEVDKLKANGPILNGLFVEEIARTIFPPIKLVGRETALNNLKMIEECLIDEKVGSIGVFGMGGVGKTTIMTQICNNVKTFDRVIWVTVSGDSYLEKLQYDISRALGLEKLQYEDTIRRSGELYEAFRCIGRFLLVLDDMWKAFPLEKLGIPEPNEENRCKIVHTTRFRHVCRGMGSQKIVKVDVLRGHESWILFQEKLGSNQKLSQEIEPIAKAIVEECDGLPLAIITVGKAMRHVDEIWRWRTALEDLKNSRTDIEGMEDDVFPCLKFSFDKLKTQRLRDCFLYCALYPEDMSIRRYELIEYWMADGLLDEMEMEDRMMGYDRGCAIIDDLVDACMLEYDAYGFVKMHDLLRDLAIGITSKSSRYVVKVGLSEKHFLWDENLMTGVGRVNLSHSNIEWLPCLPNCPELSTLLLTGSNFQGIHPLFFEHMHKLRVLDLSECVSITSLPQSISNLENLRGLWLSGCTKLKEVPSLAKLKELIVLGLSCTAIEHLPEGMEGLSNLRCLDLLATKNLKMFPAGIVPNLHRLEELVTNKSKWKWPANFGKHRGACVEEILCLTRLKELSVEFTDLNGFNSFVRSELWRSLEKYFLGISNCGCSMMYRVHGAVDIGGVTRCVRSLVLPGNTISLSIHHINCDDIHCDHITSLSEITSMWRLEQLGLCIIASWPTIKYVLTKEENHPFLPMLDRLWLFDLNNLRCICKEPTPTQSGTLANLTEIRIHRCPKLKFGFSIKWLQNLQNLRDMTFGSCEGMEEIVTEMEDTGESSNNNTITLPSLRRLELERLPMLKNICKRIFICNSLEEIEVVCCPKLKMLPLSINNMPPTFKVIRGSRKWWESLEWDNLDTQSHLQCFFSNRNIVGREFEDANDEDDDALANDDDADNSDDDEDDNDEDDDTLANDNDDANNGDDDAATDAVEDDKGAKDGVADGHDEEEERLGTKRRKCRDDDADEEKRRGTKRKKCRDGDASTSKIEPSTLPPADHNDDI